MKKIAIIGDIHGRLDMLMKMHLKIRDAYGDLQLYSTGDLIDRGPDASGVIQYCIDNNVKAVRGNHDDWLRQLCVNYTFDSLSMHEVMGGRYTAVSYGVQSAIVGENNREIAEDLFKKVPTSHKNWLSALPIYCKIVMDSGEVYWITHAGLTIPMANDLTDGLSKVSDDMLMASINTPDLIETFIWTRPNFPKIFDESTPVKKSTHGNNLYHFKNGAIQVFGHSVTGYPVIDKHYIAIDTGCGTLKREKLTAVVLPDNVFITVDDFELSGDQSK